MFCSIYNININKPTYILSLSKYLSTIKVGQFLLMLHRAGNLLIGFPSESLAFWLLRKNVRMSDSLTRFAHLLGLVSNLSDSLMVAHFWWATWVNRSWLLIFGEWPERFAHITHFWWATWVFCSHRSFWWATWAICSHPSPKKRDWANHSF